MRLQFPEEEKTYTYIFDPKSADKVYFVFLPLDKKGNRLAFVCSLITAKNDDQFLRIEPRYITGREFATFLKAINGEQFFNKFVTALSNLKSSKQVEEFLSKLKEEGVLDYDVRDVDRYLREGGSPFAYSDFSTCSLFCSEPVTPVANNKRLIRKAISILGDILGKDREVK